MKEGKSKANLVKKHFLIIILLVYMFISASYNPQKAEWKGTEEKIEGVTIVKNPKVPVFKDIIPAIKEELRIPLPGAPPEALFSSISTLVIDNTGNLHVVDSKEECVKVFAPTGHFIRAIGKVGQGPGELRSLANVFIMNSNELVLHDYQGRIFQVFTPGGQFLRSMDPPSGLVLPFAGFYKDSRDQFYWQRQVYDEETLEYWIEIVILDDELEVSKLIEKIPQPTGKDWAKKGKRPDLEVRPGGGLIIGHPWDYSFYVYDINGKLKKEIKRDYKVIPYPKEERDFWENTLGRQLSDAPYPYRHFFVDEQGWMFVRTNQRTDDRKYCYYDIFNSEGKYVYKVPIADRDWVTSGDIQARSDPFLVRGGRIYLVRDNPDGNIFISRNSISWNH